MFKKTNVQPVQNHQKMVTVIKASDDAFVKQFNDIYVKEIIPLTIEKAKDDASNNNPAPKAESFIHTDFLTTRFNRAVVDYKSSSQNGQQQFHMQQEVGIFKRQKKRLRDKLQKTNNDYRIKERAIQNLKSNREKIIQFKKVFPWIVLLGCGEALFSATSFQLLMPNMLFSLLVGIVFAVALYFSAHVGCKILRRTTSRRQFIAVLAIILSIVGVIFGVLGHFRIEYLKVMSNGQTRFELSALEFMGIQLFFFCITLFLKINYLPLKSEIEKYQLWKNAQNDVATLAKQKEHLESSLENLEQQLSTNLITRRTLITSSKDVELKLVAMYEDSYQKYVNTNLHFRSDNAIPKCFENKDELPSLTLYFQDDALLEFNNAETDDEV